MSPIVKTGALKRSPGTMKERSTRSPVTIVQRFTAMNFSRFAGTAGKKQPRPRDHRLPVRRSSDSQRGSGRCGRSRGPSRLFVDFDGVSRVQRPLRAHQIAVPFATGPRIVHHGHARQGNWNFFAGSVPPLGVVPRRVESKGKKHREKFLRGALRGRFAILRRVV